MKTKKEVQDKIKEFEKEIENFRLVGDCKNVERFENGKRVLNWVLENGN